MSFIQLNTYAKINLSLDITGVRKDGYHEVSMVMQAVDLSDVLSVELKSSETSRIFLTSDSADVPDDERNTAYRAARMMLDLYESAAQSGGENSSSPKENNSSWEVHIDIKKNIPVAAGLAGGSSNAAGVILALNRLLGMDLSLSRLCAAGEKIGADVPFCIMAAAGSQRRLLNIKGGASCALAEGIGEILTPLRSVLFWVVLVKPPAGISTAEVYRRIDEISIKKHPETAHLIEGISSGNMQKIKSSMGNVLENVTFSMCPESGALKERLNEKGCVAAMMSGSGPTVFALFQAREKAAAAVSSLRDLKEQGYSIFLVKTLQ